MKFEVYGSITINLYDTEVEADSEEEAIEKVKEMMADYYHLNVIGADHDPEKVKYDLSGIEIDESDE